MGINNLVMCRFSSSNSSVKYNSLWKFIASKFDEFA